MSEADVDHPEARRTGVWCVRDFPFVPGFFHEMPELTLRSVPRPVALSLQLDLEDLVDLGNVE